MGNTSKAIGTNAETKVVRFLEDNGIHAVRKVLHGSKDEGDLLVSLPSGIDVTFEVKGGKQTWNPNRTLMDEWLRQAEVESKNSGTICYLCVAKYRKQIKDYDLWLVKDGMRYHWFLDEWCDWIKKG